MKIRETRKFACLNIKKKFFFWHHISLFSPGKRQAIFFTYSFYFSYSYLLAYQFIVFLLIPFLKSISFWCYQDNKPKLYSFIHFSSVSHLHSLFLFFLPFCLFLETSSASSKATLEELCMSLSFHLSLHLFVFLSLLINIS